MKILNYLSFLFFILLLFQCSNHSSKLSKDITYVPDSITPIHLKKVVKKMAINGELMHSAVGYSGSKPEQYKNFEVLKEKASSADLKILTSHKNPTVRCYAFWALREQNDSELFNIALNHLRDSATISTLNGCIGGSEMVGDFMMTQLMYNLQKNKEIEKIQYLDSIFLYGDFPLYTTNSFIASISSEEVNKYPRVRDLALKGNETAIITLSKFQKEQDIPIIKKTFKETPYIFMNCVKQFPHESLKPLLENYSDKILKAKKWQSSAAWRNFYIAVATYQDEWAVNILKKPLNRVANKSFQQYYLNGVFSAVLEKSHPIFDELLYYLWKDWKKANTESIRYLIKKYEQEQEEIILKTFSNIEDYSGTSSTYSYYEVPLADFLTKKLYNLDKEKMVEIALPQIINSNVHNFKYFSPFISKTNDLRLINAALKRLETEQNPHVYLNIIDTLFELNDKNVNNRILNIIKINPDILKGWGGDEAKKILNQYNLNLK